MPCASGGRGIDGTESSRLLHMPIPEAGAEAGGARYCCSEADNQQAMDAPRRVCQTVTARLKAESR